jgi:hypothetical protein
MPAIDAPNLHSFHARGRLAATYTYAGNRYGRYAYPFADRTRPPDPNPTAQRLAMREIVALWHTLSPSQQNAWHGYALRRHLTTTAAFAACNLTRYFKAQSYVTSPP